MPFTIANLLSLFRIVAAPFLLVLSYYGFKNGFYMLFLLMLISDALDGMIARALNQTSEFGAKLDSYGDILTYITIPISIWWLFPDIVKSEKNYIFFALFVYILPAIFALFKFKELVSYHTWITKISAFFMSMGIVVLVFFHEPFLFHLSLFFLVVEALENILITLILQKPKTDLRSLWHVWRLK